MPTGELRAYFTLLLLVYLDRGGLPDDDDQLSRLTGLSLDSLTALRPYLDCLGSRADGRLHIQLAEDLILGRTQSAKSDRAPAPQRPPDPCFTIFCELYTRRPGHRSYLSKKGDFVQLATLRKRCAQARPRPDELTPERFRAAALNYFASELGNYTLADLCSRFSAFEQYALDRYGKPKSAAVTHPLAVSDDDDEWATYTSAQSVAELPLQFQRIAAEAITLEQQANVLAHFNQMIARSRALHGGNGRL